MDWDVVKKPATPAANQVLTTVAVNTRAELAEVHMAINRMDDRNAREVAQLRRTVTAQADQLVRSRSSKLKLARSLLIHPNFGAVLSIAGCR